MRLRSYRSYFLQGRIRRNEHTIPIYKQHVVRVQLHSSFRIDTYKIGGEMKEEKDNTIHISDIQSAVARSHMKTRLLLLMLDWVLYLARLFTR